MKEKEIIAAKFKEYYNIPLKSFDELSELFESEEAYLAYIKIVLYFTKAVIEPLEKKGMILSDSIIDIASGDGQMSLALFLKGYKNVTLFDMDSKRLKLGEKTIKKFLPDITDVKCINDSATNLNVKFDVLICFQTIEHLSDEGNYSVAKRKCQKEFLTAVNSNINKLCYFNAPNFTFPFDGHDTGKFLFHYLPMSIRKFLISKNIVKCSWSGISQPVSIPFFNRYLKNFSLISNYYAFDNMLEYIKNYPPFDYMGNIVPSVDINTLSKKKKALLIISNILGKTMHFGLPTLSVIYANRLSASKK
jgi:2-polyprenyl-3-methyl-5-hydroxy-6-metoxy-1,4-benzoquinol methylase